VTEVSDLTIIIPLKGADIGTTPEDLPLGRGCETAQHPQKTGLSTSIGSVNLQQFTRIKGEVNTLK
jgi:hypothetical protein